MPPPEDLFSGVRRAVRADGGREEAGGNVRRPTMPFIPEGR